MPRNRSLSLVAGLCAILSACLVPLPVVAQPALPLVGERAGRIFQAPAQVRPGDAFLAWAAFAKPPASVTAEIIDGRGRVLAAARTFAAGALVTQIETYSRRLHGILAPIPKDAAGGAYTLVVRASGERFEMRRAFVIERRDFVQETIQLNQANTDLRTVADPKKVEEAKTLFELLERSDASALFLDGLEFASPVEGFVKTSGFGDARTYAYAGGETASSVHAGVDLAVPTGTPVLVCARGRVVFAAQRIVTGNTLVVEHLPGLYSEYMHLSEIEAEVGLVVERGMRIGAAGSTGLSTGPHLHWELRAAGIAVDPEPWLQCAPLDKELAVDMMNALIEGR
ncbi:MAG: M23 family metallopeptidase [Spirochaetaceae bacterium]|nr:M23 family metallopeptidase [Spirochaetaceae bacterium]